MTDLVEKTQRIVEFVRAANELNLFDESKEGRQLKEEFLKQNDEIFESLFRRDDTIMTADLKEKIQRISEFLEIADEFNLF